MSVNQWQGSWKFVTLEIDGRPVADSMFAGSKLVIQGDRFTTYSSEANYEGTLEVNPSASPKTFNMVFTGGPEKGNTSYGIYELEGDTLKLCLTTTGSDRPQQFATKAGTGHALETLRRESA